MNLPDLILTLLLLPLPVPHLCGEAAVDQHALIKPGKDSIRVEIIFDLAEFPAETLRRQIDQDRNRRITSREERRWLGRGAQKLLNRITLEADGKPLPLKLNRDTRLELSQSRVGPYPLKIILVATTGLPPSLKQLTFTNNCFPSQPGFVRAYLEAPPEIKILTLTDLPAELAHYEELNQQINQATGSADPIPQDQWPPLLRKLSWSLANTGPGEKPTPTDKAKPAAANRPLAAKTLPESNGFSNLINQEMDTFFRNWDDGRMDWFFFLVAFLYGALHAFAPGHGKAITGAFLVGNKGTIKDALFLGLTVTITHTFVVFGLGLAYYLLISSNQVEGDFRVTVINFLQVVSALMIVGVGAFLAWTQGRKLLAHSRGGIFLLRLTLHLTVFATVWLLVRFQAPIALLCGLGAALTWNLCRRSDPPHHDHHHHEHDHDHGHEHHHGHSHDIPVDPDSGRPRFMEVLYLGVTGGLVPCPTGLFIISLAIAMGRPLLGLSMVAIFSLGMAAVLVAIGIGAVKGYDLAVKVGGQGAAKAFFLLPIISALFITVLGVLMTFWALSTSPSP